MWEKRVSFCSPFAIAEDGPGRDPGVGGGGSLLDLGEGRGRAAPLLVPEESGALLDGQMGTHSHRAG